MENNHFIWSQLVQLGSNCWNEEGNTKGREHRSTPCASPKLRFFKPEWDKHIEDLKNAGVNMLLIDLAEAMRYETHPELAVEGSWSRDRMMDEIERLQNMGFELVPKLNFSACHDVWLKDYSKMLSTPVYYDVCSDLIGEVCQVFQPKYFHLGMDEENAANQRNYLFAAMRQGELWWHDLYFLIDCVEKGGARPWVWSDLAWDHTEEYLRKMPREVIQSNWYYGGAFFPEDPGYGDYQKKCLVLFDLLEEKGYDQIPTGSVWAEEDNFVKLADYCKKRISPAHFMGMLQTSWERIDPDWMYVHEKAVKQIKLAKDSF